MSFKFGSAHCIRRLIYRKIPSEVPVQVWLLGGLALGELSEVSNPPPLNAINEDGSEMRSVFLSPLCDALKVGWWSERGEKGDHQPSDATPFQAHPRSTEFM